MGFTGKKAVHSFWLLSLLSASALAVETQATYLGAFEVREISVSSRGQKTQALCGQEATASSRTDSRAEDCGARIHAYRQGNALLLVRNEGTSTNTFLLYANPFKKQFCQSWIPRESANAGAQALFLSKACRAYLTDEGSYFFSAEKDPLQFMIESQVITLATIGVPIGIRSHLKIRLEGDTERPSALQIRDRVDGSVFFISTGINYDYTLFRL